MSKADTSWIPKPWQCVDCKKTFFPYPDDLDSIPAGLRHKTTENGWKIVVGSICNNCMKKLSKK